MIHALIVLGSTGGHIYPGLVLGEELRSRGEDAVFIVADREIARDIVKKSGFRFSVMAGEGLKRKFSPALGRFVLKFAKGIFQSLAIIIKERPRVVVGMGGYLTPQVVLSARLMGLPVVIHEQNVMPGLANRMLARIATRIAVSFSATAEYFPSRKVVFTGNPVRKEILACSREEGTENLNLDKNRKNILIFGGSQGSSSINFAMVSALEFLTPLKDKVQFIHITGIKQFSSLMEAYRKQGYGACVLPYLHRMEYAYAASDLVISRSGATTLAELVARNLPSVLIPYPHATEDHQTVNADLLVREGAAVIIPDKDLTGERLADVLLSLFRQAGELDWMKEKAGALYSDNSAGRFADVIESVTKI